MSRVEQIAGKHAVTIGVLRRSLRRALGIVELTINKADLYTQVWYREAKAALGGREDPLTITRDDLVVSTKDDMMKCRKCGATFCPLDGASLSRVEAEVEKALDMHDCKSGEKKS